MLFAVAGQRTIAGEKAPVLEKYNSVIRRNMTGPCIEIDQVGIIGRIALCAAYPVRIVAVVAGEILVPGVFLE